MTHINSQIISCPYCKKSITVDELGEYVSANPEIKKQAVEEQFQLWGGAYDKNYLIQKSRMRTWTLFFDAPSALVIFYLSFLLLSSLSYCIRKRLISDVISDSSLIRKVIQPELGSTW